MDEFYKHPVVVRRMTSENYYGDIVVMFVEQPANIRSCQLVNCYVFNDQSPDGNFTSIHYSLVMGASEPLSDYESTEWRYMVANQGWQTRLVDRRDAKMYQTFLENKRDKRNWYATRKVG